MVAGSRVYHQRRRSGFPGDTWPDQPCVPASFRFRQWQPAKPRSGPTISFFELQIHFRTQCLVASWKPLDWALFTTFDFILHGYSDGYIFEDSFNSFSFLVLHAWDSVPNRSADGSISCLVGERGVNRESTKPVAGGCTTGFEAVEVGMGACASSGLVSCVGM